MLTQMFLISKRRVKIVTLPLLSLAACWLTRAVSGCLPIQTGGRVCAFVFPVRQRSVRQSQPPPKEPGCEHGAERVS